MIMFRQFRHQYRRLINEIIKGFFVFLAIGFIIFSVLLVIDIFTVSDLIIDNLDDMKSHHLKSLYAGVALILTVVLIIGAWRQIRNVNKISQSDFLLRLDMHYSSKEIIKARTIIHKIYRSKGDDKVPMSYKVNETAKEIDRMRTSDEEKEQKDFIYLLNFLEYLETVAMFCNRGAIYHQNLEDLSGASLRFYSGIFSKLITSRRINTNNNDYYSELEMCVRHLDY